MTARFASPVPSGLSTPLDPLNLLLDTLPDVALFRLDPEGKVTGWNPGAERLFGYPEKEILGREFAVFFREEDRRVGLPRDLLDRAAREARIQGEGWRLRRDGQAFPAEATLAFHDLAGSSGFSVITRDLTDRKNLERLRIRQALGEDREDRLRALEVILEGVDNAILARDPQGRLVFANSLAARFLGAGSVDELLATRLETWLGRFELLDEVGRPVPEGKAPGLNSELGTTLRSKVLRLRQRATGEERWFLLKAMPVFLPDGGLAMGVSFIHDITSLKTREHQERRDKAQLRIILEGISDAILVHSVKSGRLIYANLAGLSFLGAASLEARTEAGPPGPEASGGAVREFLDEKGDVLPAEETPGTKALAGRTEMPRLLRVRGGKGDPEKWVVAQASPVHDENGAVQYTVQIIRDITEARETEERLRQSQKMEAVGRLAGGIAHDFNNLLTAINGYSELGIVRAAAVDKDLRDSLVEIREAGRRAASLTQQLLAFSRKQFLSPRSVDINEVVGRMETMLRRLIGEDVVLIFRPGQGLPAIRADISQVEQVILNLAVNARDAMPSGGSLEMETSLFQGDAAWRASHPEGQGGPHVRISIRDTGVGMDPTLLAKIFEPFFTTKEAGKGTGLGLSTVYGIVKQSGGQVEVESEPGMGTVFRILFPAASAPAEEPLPAEEQAEPGRGGPEDLILLVEDEESVRNLVGRILSDHGYPCLTAENGDQAIALLQERPGMGVRLLLSDVVLKGMSGRDLADRIRVLSPSVRVLYMSGYSDDDIMRHGVLEPGVDFINKPFSIPALLGRISTILKA